MKLYYSPGACSLADHIALHEAGFDPELVKVDLKTKQTEDGRDYLSVNPKGYVPALELDDGETLTENIAILDWVARQPGGAALGGPSQHKRLEMLAFISTEIHKSFAPFFQGGDDAAKAAAGERIGKRLGYLAERLDGDYLFGAQASVADAYLAVMLMWAGRCGLTLPEPLPAYFARMRGRAAVKVALGHEGLG